MTVALLVTMLLVGTRIRAARIATVGVGLAVFSVAPSAALPLVVVGGLQQLRRISRFRARAREQLDEDVALLADLTALGLTGGLGVRQALETAAAGVGGELATEVSLLLRSAQVEGLAVATSRSTGVGRDLYRVIGRTMRSGASVVDQVTRVADDMHAAAATRRLERLRKVPVAMLFPLTLLILPGFLLLTVAPAIVDAFLHIEM